MNLIERNHSGEAIVVGIGVPIWKIDYLLDCGVSDKELQDRYWLSDDQLQAAKDFASANSIEMACDQERYFSYIWEVLDQNQVKKTCKGRQ